jgi:Na+-driven multidrug efflux pump
MSASKLAGGTRTRLIAQTSGMFLLMLGVAYVRGICLKLGVAAVYASIILYYAWAMAYVTVGFYRGRWSNGRMR